MNSELKALNDTALAAAEALATAKRELDNFEPDDGEAHEMYDDWLDEMHEMPNWLSGLPSVTLKKCDECAYDEGFSNWLDGELRENPERFDGYDELVAAVEEAEAALADAEAAVEDYEPADGYCEECGGMIPDECDGDCE